MYVHILYAGRSKTHRRARLEGKVAIGSEASILRIDNSRARAAFYCRTRADTLAIRTPFVLPYLSDITDAFCAVLCCAALTGMMDLTMGVPGMYRARTVPDRVPYRWAVIPYKVYALRS